MLKATHLAERWFTILSLVLYSGGVVSLLISGGISQGDGRDALHGYGLYRVITVLVYAITFYLITKRWKTALPLLTHEKFILALLALAFMSIAWSDVPMITLRRCIALVGTTLFGIYFTGRYNHSERQTLLCQAFGVIAVSSFFFVFFLPEYGIMGGPIHPGSWRGIYTHKNLLGRIIVIAIPALLILPAKSTYVRCLNNAIFLLLIILLLFSDSKSGMLISSFMLFVISLYWIHHKQYMRAVFIIICALTTSGYLFMHVFPETHASISVNEAQAIQLNTDCRSTARNGDIAAPPFHAQHNALSAERESAPETIPPSTSLFGKLPSNLRNLTGRMQLWEVIWNMIRERPWIGYGYGAFWLAGDGPSARVWQAVHTWKPANGHNGILDLWLDLGLIGLLIFFTSVGALVIKVVVQRAAIASAEGFYILIFILCYLLVNLTESALFKHNTIFWILYVSAALSGKRSEAKDATP